MTNRLMISVAAAALIAGTSFANAQGMGREGGSGSTMQQQQSAPSSERGNSAAPANRDAVEPSSGQSSGPKSTQSEEKSPAATKNQRAQGNMQDPKSKGMSSENEGTKNGAKDMKAQGREDNNTAQGQGREDRNTAQGREDRNGTMNAQSKGAESKSSTTVGQAGAGAKLSTEQRTKITTVIRSQHVAPLDHVNFSISVGTRVPHDVRFYPLPTEVVTIYPEWRGYEFILVGEQVVVVDPATFEIVAVIEA